MLVQVGLPKSRPHARPIFANEDVANTAQTGRDQSQYSLYCAPCLRGPKEGRSHRAPLQPYW